MPDRGNRRVSNSSRVAPRAPAALDRAHPSLHLGPSPLILRLFRRLPRVGGHGDVQPVAVPLQHLQGEGVGLYLAVSSFHLPRLAEVVEGLVRYQEHQRLVLAPEFKGAVEPPPLDALAVTGGNVTIAYPMTFGELRPRPVGVTIQGREAHELADRVRSVPAHVAIDPVPRAVARRLAYVPKGVPLTSSAPQADPVGLGPVVSFQPLAHPPQPFEILQGCVHPPEPAHPTRARGAACRWKPPRSRWCRPCCPRIALPPGSGAGRYPTARTRARLRAS